MKSAIAAVLALIVIILVAASAYTIKETEQVIITQFGKPIGSAITEAGLHFKTPFVQVANRLDKRVLEWDGQATTMPTKDKLYLSVNTFARWRIAEPEKFFIRLRDERSAQSRLSDILGSETRNTVAGHDLVEVVRTTKDRKPVVDKTLEDAAVSTGLPPINIGRAGLEAEVFKAAKPKLVEYGIELLDMRFKRVAYDRDVAESVFQRMVSERQQIAARYRSEGEGEAAKILGQRERDIKQIDSEAYRQVQTIEGKADAEASSIYAEAYNQSAEAREFYSFLRSLETYRTAFDRGTSMVMTTEDGFLRYLKGGTGGGDAVKLTTEPGSTLRPREASPRTAPGQTPAVSPAPATQPANTPPPVNPVATPPPTPPTPAPAPTPLEATPEP